MKDINDLIRRVTLNLNITSTERRELLLALENRLDFLEDSLECLKKDLIPTKRNKIEIEVITNKIDIFNKLYFKFYQLKERRKHN